VRDIPVVRHADILRFILRYTEKHGFPPSMAELRAETGLAVSTIAHHLEVMEARGYITKKAKTPRTIVVTDRGRQRVEQG
jgi:DNA-binding MarR family transcriptional regulator